MIALRRFALGVLVSCVGFSLATAAQSVAAGDQTPSRDAARLTGSAFVTGVVTDEGTGRPLRRAAVALSGGGLSTPNRAITDEGGRFAFSSVPFGQYTLNAQKPGYLTTYYGSSRPGRAPDRPAITLSAGAPSANISLRASRGAVITGIVVDPNGRPAPNLRISLQEYRMTAGERQLVAYSTPGPAMTDDRGAYRVFGLLPGDYIVGVTPLSADAVPIGAIDVQWAQQQIRQGQAGLAAGTAASSPAVRPPDRPQPMQYGRVFFPGTADPAGAVPITLRPGEERAGVDFGLQYVPSSRVEGVVMGPDGKPMSRLQLTVTQPGVPGNVPYGINWTDNAAGGKFTINGLSPGQYRLSARTNNSMTRAPGPPASPAAPLLWGITDLALSGADVTDVAITLRPSLTMSGRMIFAATTQAPPQNLGNIRVTVLPVANSDLPAPAATATVAADGTFTVTGVLPGRHRLNATGPALARIGGPPASWLLKSATLNGQDISDRLFDVTPDGSLQNVVLTWSDRPAEVSGKLLDPSGHPAAGYTVVLFTTDRTFWGLQSRRTLRFPPGPEGQFRFQGLLPGEYYISAVTDVGPEDFADPAFFEQLVNASLKIRLEEGEKKTQDLRLADQK